MTNTKKILVTGATGFLGRECVNTFSSDAQFKVKAAVRNLRAEFNESVEVVCINNIDEETDWSEALYDVDIVVHTAARVHVMKDSVLDPEAEFTSVNVDGACNLVTQSIKAGVSRFIFISSIKVNGEFTTNYPFSNDDIPKPEDPYAISKYKAELAIKNIAKGTSMGVVIIRPPLIYGPDVKGNLESLSRLIDKGFPFPLGSIRNKRDLISIYNLVDLIRQCSIKDSAIGQIFLASDNSPLSTPELIQYLALNQRKVSLLPIPVWFLKLCLGLLGKKDFIDRLCGNMEINIEFTMKTLAWRPPYTVLKSFQKIGAKR